MPKKAKSNYSKFEKSIEKIYKFQKGEKSVLRLKRDLQRGSRKPKTEGERWGLGLNFADFFVGFVTDFKANLWWILRRILGGF